MQKKILIFSMLFVFVWSFIIVEPQLKAEAGAPKLIYEMGDTFVDASIKAIQARKGFKVVDGAKVDTGESVSDVFTGAVKKGMQDTALQSWNVINGGAFDKTPLKGMSGWLKVGLGTVAFVTGADLLFDIYDKVQKNESVEYVTEEMESFFLDSNVIRKDFNDSTWKFERTILENVPLMVLSTGEQIYSITFYHYYQLESFNASRVDQISTTASIKKEFPFGSLGTVHDKGVSSLLSMALSTGLWSIQDSVYPYVDNQNKIVVNPSDIVTTEVPNINTNRENQFLIVPDPAVYNTPEKMDQAINENWDMVSNPEKWLTNNPDHDPSPELTEPPPDIDTPPEDGGILQSLWDWLKGILQSILDAIKALAGLLGLMPLVNMVESLVASFATLLSYLNPFSENFFLWIALVPSEGYFTNFFNDIYSEWSVKFPIIDDLFNFFDSVKNSTYGNSIPKFLIHLPDDMGGQSIPIINFAMFTEYRTLILNFIRFTAWFIFLKKIWSRLPRVVY